MPRQKKAESLPPEPYRPDWGSRWDTASNLDRTVLCPASSVMEKLDIPSDNAIKGRIWGETVHTWVETGKIAGPDWAAKGFEEKLAVSGADDTLRLEFWPDHGVHELALVWDLETTPYIVVERGPDGRVAWPKSPGSLRIKLDFAAWGAESTGVDGHLWVDDLKTGRYSVPAESLQVGSAVAGLGAIYGYDYGYGTITHWPRYPKQGKPRRSKPAKHELIPTRDLLRRTRDSAERAKQEIDKGNDPPPDTVFAGDHCQWCPSKHICPIHRF